MKLIAIARVAAALTLVLAPIATAAPGALAGKIDQLDDQFSRIASTGEQLRSMTFLTARDFETSPEQSYASGMYNVALEALNNAKIASDSKGQKGDVAGLKQFEDLALVHEEGLGREVELNDQFMERIRTGAVQIDPTYVATWSPRDKAAFKAFLAPSAAKSYSSLEGVTPAAAPQTFAAGPEFVSACSAAAPCVSPCLYHQWGACLTCVMKASSAVRAAWGRFQSCWAGGGKPKWMPLWVWRNKCLATFIAILA